MFTSHSNVEQYHLELLNSAFSQRGRTIKLSILNLYFLWICNEKVYDWGKISMLT